MKKSIHIFTSSRADYGILKPLIANLANEAMFDCRIVVFGSHLEPAVRTVSEIEADNLAPILAIPTNVTGDSPLHISQTMARTIERFSTYLDSHRPDLIVCLGDRYEMFAAIVATVSLRIPVAHLHGGEETLGAIDNELRHCISLFSRYHFPCTDPYAERVKSLTNSSEVYNVGALSIDNLKHQELFTLDEFRSEFGIDLNKKTILFTFHPETVSFEKNEVYIKEIRKALEQLKSYQIVITMPNLDTMNRVIVETLESFIGQNANTFGVGSFGMKGYLTCLKYCSFMMGNSSSGFIEAGFFSKWVINLGNRQKGRIVTPNIINVPDISVQNILDSVNGIDEQQSPNVPELYGNGTAADQITNILKQKLL